MRRLLATRTGTGTTRSGKAFTPFQPIYCKGASSFPELLKQCMQEEWQRISAYEDSLRQEESAAMLCEGSAARESGANGSDALQPASRQSAGADQPTFPTLEAPPRKLNDSHTRRKRARRAKAFERGQLPRPEVLKAVLNASEAIPAEFDMSKAPAASGAYCAKRMRKDEARDGVHGLQYFEAEGFDVIRWDASMDRPIVSPEGVVLAVLVAPPKDPGFKANVAEVDALMAEQGGNAFFEGEEKVHIRGSYPAVNVGVTHARGTLHPVTLKNHKRSAMVETLMSHRSVRALAGFASAAFALWNPGVYSYYKSKLGYMYLKMPELKRNFDNSIFPAATFNFGPNVYTAKHRDTLNCPFGWCAIQALGEFDHTKGGHLVLWDLKLVLEFPAGSVILIPSATLAHSNVPVRPGERRASFTQYASGGLFRFVDYGMRTERQLKEEDPELYRQMMEARSGRWAEGLSLMSKLADLKAEGTASGTP